jgi:hypothetical protein
MARSVDVEEGECNALYSATHWTLHYVSFCLFNSALLLCPIVGRQSKLTISSKLLAYKVVLKPIWTYGLQLWGTTSTSNIEILERFQSKALRMIADTPWYVTNALRRRYLHIPSVKEEIQRLSSHYSARLNSHPNLLTANLKKQPINRRLQRTLQTDLPTRLLV